jgi:hypothetical protein
MIFILFFMKSEKGIVLREGRSADEYIISLVYNNHNIDAIRVGLEERGDSFYVVEDSLRRGHSRDAQLGKEIQRGSVLLEVDDEIGASSALYEHANDLLNRIASGEKYFAVDLVKENALAEGRIKTVQRRESASRLGVPKVDDEFTMQVSAFGYLPSIRTFSITGSRCPVRERDDGR